MKETCGTEFIGYSRKEISLGRSSGIYMGDDYYRFIKRQAKMENILRS